MSPFRFAWVTIIQTLLRVLPFPCKTGLVTIGNPGRDSPVLLTCNFRLTVERVKRVLQGMDAYLLVANSRGVNVWCAATGGLLTNHDVISVLKTSGVEELVNHRKVILPQLAATGIERPVIQKKVGWKVVWGPVEANDIPAFVGGEKSARMRIVTFPWQRRIEMAVAWAFPMSLLALLVLPFGNQAVLSLIGLAWALSLLIFLCFPLYQKHLRAKKKRFGVVFFDFGQGVLLMLWVVFILGLISYAALSGDSSWVLIPRWGLSSLLVLFVLSIDLMGSTPVYKSGLHEDRLLRIALDEQRCAGASFCEQVCPIDVFEMDNTRRLVTLPRAEQCVQCGACIVQCPFDALYFQSPDGNVVRPDTVRQFKLNLLGTRQATSHKSGAQCGKV